MMVLKVCVSAELLSQSQAALAPTNHELRFIHFQDLVALKPPDSKCNTCLATQATVAMGDTVILRCR